MTNTILRYRGKFSIFTTLRIACKLGKLCSRKICSYQTIGVYINTLICCARTTVAVQARCDSPSRLPRRILRASLWSSRSPASAICIKVTTLSGVSYASVYDEQTHSRQCCNLFIAWLSTQPVIVLPSLARACNDQSTVHLDWQLGGYSSARVRNVWGINRVLLRISIWFSCQFVGFHVANRAVTRLLLLRRCMKCFGIFL